MALIILKLGLSSENPCLSMESSQYSNLLKESDNSLVNKFLKIQMEKPSKKDWINSVVKDLLLEISLSADEIRVLSTAQFKILWTKVL